jgi:hypothetical protein
MAIKAVVRDVVLVNDVIAQRKSIEGWALSRCSLYSKLTYLLSSVMNELERQTGACNFSLKLQQGLHRKSYLGGELFGRCPENRNENKNESLYFVVLINFWRHRVNQPGAKKMRIIQMLPIHSCFAWMMYNAKLICYCWYLVVEKKGQWKPS